MLTKKDGKEGNSQRSPPKVDLNELELDKTQESSCKSSRRLKRSESKIAQLSGYSTRRVRFKRQESDNEDVVNIDKDLVKNDKTLRDENGFLEQIEKCKMKRLERICHCPFTTCYKVSDWWDRTRAKINRIRWLCFTICCPPCCCLLQRAAFWPPPCEYFFFKSEGDYEFLRVRSEEEAILMTERKKTLKKVKRARKCVPGERYRFGMSHPCMEDVKYVEGFALKTSRKIRIGCIFIPCPDGRRPRFTLLYSHPNGSDLSDHLIGCPSLVDMARFYRCDVYSYDYSGYGISGGVACEDNMYADIGAVYDYITLEKKVDPKTLVLHGYSIGSAATVELLRHKQEQKPAGVILQSPPTSFLRVLGHWMGKKQHLENPTCCLDRCVTIDKIHEIQIPILIIHGKEDKTVPVEHGELLCQRAVNKVTPEWVPETAHDNIENCKVVWRRIRKFVKDLFHRELKLNGDNMEQKNKDKIKTLTS